MKRLKGNEKVEIRMVLMNNDKPSYVEFYAHSDNRNHIIDAERFCEIFGYSMDELRAISESL
jgi:hypothetical protein